MRQSLRTFNCTNKFRYLCDTKVSDFDLLKTKTTCSISPKFLHLFGPLDIMKDHILKYENLIF